MIDLNRLTVKALTNYIKPYNLQATLKGVEYLVENSAMQKAVNIVN